MEESLQLRKRKALARARNKRRLAQGQLRLEQVSFAATATTCKAGSPLILPRGKVPAREAG
jgi:hypothetical protein